MRDTPTNNWRNTIHDWARDLDLEHLEQIRQDPAVFAPSGVLHLIFEVLAYAGEEAINNGSGQALVTLHCDGSVSVADNGRGTDTRVDDQGRTIKKPVIATKDLRFFDSPGPVLLPDGHPRRGMSVAAALSEWLVHTNRRRNGSWTQRYQHGIPVTDLTSIPDDGTTGTTLRLLPDTALVSNTQIIPPKLRQLTTAFRPHLSVDVHEQHA
ncbi:MAG TPA: ATP-binding protein [Pseudonocardiaceae bacterium]